MTLNYLADVALLLVVFGTLAVALAVPYRWGGRLILCQSTLVGIGAYTMAACAAHWGWPPWAGLAFAAILGGLLGSLLPLLLGRLDGSAFALVTFLIALAGQEMFENLSSITGGPNGLPGIGMNFPIVGWPPKALAAILIAIVLLAALLLFQRLLHGRFGRSVRALRDDFVGAQLDGVRPWPCERDAYAVFGALTAIVGALWALVLPRVVSGYFDVMTLGLLVVLGCIVAGGESPWLALGGMCAVVLLNEGAQQLPVSPEVRGDLPILLVGLLYIVMMRLFPARGKMAPLLWFSVSGNRSRAEVKK